MFITGTRRVTVYNGNDNQHVQNVINLKNMVAPPANNHKAWKHFKSSYLNFITGLWNNKITLYQAAKEKHKLMTVLT